MLPALLHSRYREAMLCYWALRQHHDGVSPPHLVRPPDSYFTSPTRLMIVGQEPLGWGEWLNQVTDADLAIDRLLAGYDEFDLGAKHKRTPFWAAANRVFARVRPGAPRRDYLWSNLVKIAQAGRRPTASVEDAICAIPLLETELRAFRPDIVVFFTGPNYDDRLSASLPGVVSKSISPFLNRLSGHDALPDRAFRSFHPGYLRRAKQWSVIEDLAARCGVTST